MARSTRKKLIEELEQFRNSRVLTYVMADRVPIPSQMANDAVRYIYDHLREMGHVENLDLLIYSRGGDIDVPWRVATALRAAAENWRILVPRAANSAATLLALGADEIVLGPQGELGPIDPIVGVQRGGDKPIQDNVGVEDVMAYLEFVKQRAGLSDQEALAASLAKLAERLDPVSLGRIHRTHSHIREVAGRMLRSRREPASEQATAAVIETLAERVYAHGHAIGFRDAKEIGLPVELADGDLDRLMWELLCQYEGEMKMLESVDPRQVTESVDLHQEAAKVAAIESTIAVHECIGTLEIRAQRQIPPNLALNLNLNLQLPGINPVQLPPALQQLLQQLQPAIAQQAQEAVQQALRDQAPVQGFEAYVKAPTWKRSE